MQHDNLDRKVARLVSFCSSSNDAAIFTQLRSEKEREKLHGFEETSKRYPFSSHYPEMYDVYDAKWIRARREVCKKGRD